MVKIVAKSVTSINVLGGEMVINYEPAQTEPPPPPKDFGAHHDVETLTLDLAPYGLPDPKGPRVRLEEFGGHQGGSIDNRSAVLRAIETLSERGGGTIDVTGAQYGVQDWLRAHNVKNVSIVGSGKGSGFVAMPRPFDRGRGRWGCLIEYWGATGCQFRDFEVDLDDQPIGGLYHKDDDGTVFARVWVHDGGGTIDSSGKPLAMIKGSGWSKNFHMVGCLVEDSVGDAGRGSGVRGYWGAPKRFDDGLVSNCIFRRCGHTALAVNPHDNVRIEFVTSNDNAGAGVKTDKPEDALRTGTDWLALISRCDFSRNGFWGAQIEARRTHTNLSRFSDQTAAWSTHDEGNFDKVVEGCEMNGCREAGIWCDARSGSPQFGGLAFRNNKINGALSRAGIWFADRNTNPVGPIIITGNMVSGDRPAVHATRQIMDHDGTVIENNT